MPPPAYNTALAVDPGDHVMSVVPKTGPLRTLEVHVAPGAPALTVRAEDARSKLDAKAEPPATPSRGTADVLFEEGKRLRDAGMIQEACSKFAESQALAPGVGITLHLGDCYERLGQTASAWAEFTRAEKLAADQKDSREAVAHARAVALEPKLHQATVATAPPADSPDALGALGATTPATPAASPPASSEDRAASTRRWVEIGLLGGAVVAAGVGAGLLVVKNNSMSNGGAGGNPYVDPVVAAASKVSFVVAGAAAASAIVLYLVAPKKKDTALYVSPTTVVGGAGASLGGSF